MTTPRTVAGQAALSGMRPYVKRALAQTILAIEAQAIAPYVEALREADRVLESLVTENASSPWSIPFQVGLAQRAQAARQLVKPVLAQHGTEERA